MLFSITSHKWLIKHIRRKLKLSFTYLKHFNNILTIYLKFVVMLLVLKLVKIKIQYFDLLLTESQYLGNQLSVINKIV